MRRKTPESNRRGIGGNPARSPLAPAVLVCALAGAGVKAQEVAEIPLFSAPPGTAALGGGIRIGQSPYRAADNEDQRHRDLVPMYLYEGRYVFFRGASAGAHFIRTDALELSLLGKYRFQKLDPESNVFYQGVNEREQSFDAGFQIAYKRNWGKLKLSWVTDTLDRHNGQELQFTYRHDLEAGPWVLSPFASWSWQDENLTNYYFGVSDAEARPDLPAFSAGDSQWVSFGLNSSWQLMTE